MTMNTNINPIEFARQRLAQVVQQGITKAGPVVQQILANQPEDSLVAVNTLQFGVQGTEVMVRANDNVWALHAHAENQLYERLGGSKFKSFANEQREPNHPWRNALLERNLSEFASHTRGRYLVRAVRQGPVLQARAMGRKS
jgi:hypothetical protein